jgi:hypothetical protein
MLIWALPIAFGDIFSGSKFGLFYAKEHGLLGSDNSKIEALA